jgi:hypothetical protein
MEDAQSKVHMLKTAECIKHSACGDFKNCVRAVSDENRKARRLMRLREQIAAIKSEVAKKDWFAAQKTCSRDYLASAARKNGHEEAAKLAEEFFGFCLQNIPIWLGHLRDAGTKERYFQTCSENFLKKVQATAEQKKVILSVCNELLVLSRSKRYLDEVKKTKDTYVTKNQFPWQCGMKEGETLEKLKTPASEKLFAEFKQLCYQDIGYKLLEANYKELLRKRYRFCSLYLKNIATGFQKWNLVSPQQETVLKFYYKICKI